MPVVDWKTFKIYGKIWLWKKKIIRISYKKAHHFPASCVCIDIDIVLKEIFSGRKQMRIQGPTPLLMKNLWNFQEFGKILCSHVSSNVPSIHFRMSGSATEKDKNISISIPGFDAWDL